jgi:hypothetical protein
MVGWFLVVGHKRGVGCWLWESVDCIDYGGHNWGKWVAGSKEKLVSNYSKAQFFFQF